MRITILTLLTIIFFGGAFVFEHYHKDNGALEQYAALIQKNLHQHEEDINRLSKSFLADNATQHEDKGIGFLQKQQLGDKKYSIFLYQNDSLLYWNNNKVLTIPDSAGTMRYLDNGYYYVKKINLNETLCLLAAIPIKYAYQIDPNSGKDYNYLENNFAADDDIASFLSLATNGKGAAIYSLDGKKCCDISFYQEKKLSRRDQYQLLILFGLAFFCLAFLINALSLQLMQSQRPKLGIVFFLLALLGIKLLSTSIDLNQRLGNVTFFLSSLEPTTFNNTGPGAMLINILLLLWFIVFHYKHIKQIDASLFSNKMKISLAVILYVAIIIGLLMTIQTHKVIISSPDLHFDFDNVFYIDVPSTMTILTILLVWFALFLFNYKTTLNIQTLGFNRLQRLGILGIVLVILYALLYYKNIFEQPEAGIILFCFIYISSLDVFSEGKQGSNFTWLIGWLVFFGLTSTVLFYSYHLTVNYKNLEDSVKKLATEKDNNVIRDLDDIASYIQANIDSIKNRETLNQAFQVAAKRKGYLIDHYTLNLSDTVTYADKTNARALPSNDSLKGYEYDVRLPIKVDGHTKYYRLEAVLKDDQNQTGYEESLFKIPYLKINGLSKISYSIFINNTLVKGYGQDYVNDLSTINLKDFKVEKKTENKDYAQYIFKPNAKKVIIGQISYGGRHKMIFLFTYLLVFLLGISLFIVTLNSFTHIIDNFFVLSFKGSLQMKVQQTIIGLIIFSCIFIGSITIIYFTNIFENNSNSFIYEKLNAIQNNIENDIQVGNMTQETISNLVIPISKTHKIDINIYDLSGKMINPKGKNVFQKGIFGSIMNADAFQLLSSNGENSCLLDEKIGNFAYKTAYGKIVQNKKTIAYFGLPSYRKEWERKNALSDTIGHLLSFYVLLIMTVVIFSYLVARLLLQPLRDVGAKLKLVKLGQLNLDVEWKGNDALGDLIREFNQMLGNLRKQAQAGEQTARDEAWQKMAKQIAHDIRNTLTPMKLSIQFLEHSTLIPDLNSEIRERIKRISATLVEQISHFNQIANNFGDFAKAKTEPTAIEKVDLNDFLLLNCELFKNNLESQTAVNIHLPSEKYMVNIDRAQMARVVTNLITNAQQAIPENREGRIDIYLFEQEDKAVIRVSDNGFGIPSEQMEQIFQPNFTTKNSGTGLGLAICRKLVQDVGGNIYCSSILHQGSDFYVELPIEDKLEPQIDEDNDSFEG